MATGRAMRWIGRVITGLTALMFLFSASMKLVGGPEIQKAMEPLGLPGSLLLPLAILELSCLLVYLLPPTSVLGAIVLTGYLGGAILTHVRVGEPFVFPLVVIKVSPSDENSAEWTRSVCPASVFRLSHVCVSQIFAVRSQLAEAIERPSGENRRCETMFS